MGRCLNPHSHKRSTIDRQPNSTQWSLVSGKNTPVIPLSPQRYEPYSIPGHAGISFPGAHRSNACGGEVIIHTGYVGSNPPQAAEFREYLSFARSEVPDDSTAQLTLETANGTHSLSQDSICCHSYNLGRFDPCVRRLASIFNTLLVVK